MKGGDIFKIRKGKELKEKQKFGDIFYAELQRDGRVQGGCRPVIIAQGDELNKASQTVTVIPITSKLKYQDFPTHIVIQPSDVNGLTKPSMAMTEHIQTIPVSRLRSKAGILPRELMASLGNAIRWQIPFPPVEA